MSNLQIIFETNFSIERRIVNSRNIEMPPRPDFLIVHFLKSKAAETPAGASLLANPDQSISLGKGFSKEELLLVRLAPELLIEAAARLRLYRADSQLLFRQSLNPLTGDTRLRAVLESIADEVERKDAGWREIIGSLIDQLSVYLLRRHINVQRSDEIELSRVGIVDRRLRKAIEFMHDNCSRELKLSEIAGAAYLSEYHFARLFKKITGATPHGYLAALRVERARRLLAETDLSIAEIGAQVGYVSQSHFTKVFREATGITPRVFRQGVTTYDR